MLYNPDEICGFRFTRDMWGAFSNLSKHHVDLFGVRWKNSEALYQAARFPTHPVLQDSILAAHDAATAKAIAKEHYHLTVPDWGTRRIKVMFTTVVAKRLTHKDLYDRMFEATAGRKIVEISKHDDFWGAKPLVNGNLKGNNALGFIWDCVRDGGDEFIQAIMDQKHLSLMPYYNPNTLENFCA